MRQLCSKAKALIFSREVLEFERIFCVLGGCLSNVTCASYVTLPLSRGVLSCCFYEAPPMSCRIWWIAQKVVDGECVLIVVKLNGTWAENSSRARNNEVKVLSLHSSRVFSSSHLSSVQVHPPLIVTSTLPYTGMLILLTSQREFLHRHWDLVWYYYDTTQTLSDCKIISLSLLVMLMRWEWKSRIYCLLTPLSHFYSNFRSFQPGLGVSFYFVSFQKAKNHHATALLFFMQYT